MGGCSNDVDNYDDRAHYLDANRQQPSEQFSLAQWTANQTGMGIDWDGFFRQASSDFSPPRENGVPSRFNSNNTVVVVHSPAYFRRLNELVQETNAATMEFYLLWRLVVELSPALADQYQSIDRERQLLAEGADGTDGADGDGDKRSPTTKPMENRWHTCIHDTNQAMGLLVGHLYVQSMYADDEKTPPPAVQTIVDRVRYAMAQKIQQLSWMDADTKREALAKVPIYLLAWLTD